MDRGASAFLVSLLVVPVAALLVLSGFDLPRQAYVGLALRDDRVGMVSPDGPAARAGLGAGDVVRLDPPARGLAATVSPLSGARPGVPLHLAVRRAAGWKSVVIVPEPLPAGERRLRSAMLVVACGFVLLGGWVWSERRDRLTGPFRLLTLLFGVWLAPPPIFASPLATLALDLIMLGATLGLPAACIHFFSRFPEPTEPRGGLPAGVAIGYAIALLLFAPWIAALMVGAGSNPAARPLIGLLELLGTLWFVAGLLSAGVLFVRSYLAVDATDARRRLRVAVLGTLLGVGPLLVVIVTRSLAPSVALPGERAAIPLTLLAPASFAYAIAVHRIFEFRVAVRSVRGPLAVGALLGVAYLVGESLGPFHQLRAQTEVTGVALAAMGLVATVAGPARPLFRSLAQKVVPASGLTLASSLSRASLQSDDQGAHTLARACAAVRDHLRLDRCLAIERHGDAWSAALIGPPDADGHGATIDLSPGLSGALTGAGGPLAVAETDLPASDRDALDALGTSWILPVGEREPIAALLLGRRLGGPWLDRSESDDLTRFARELELALENTELRRVARTHGALDRELEQAGAIQTHLLPRRAPVYPALDCAAATLSAEPVGGDYYDFVAHGERRFTLAVGDAMGHGVPAALLLAGVQARFRSAASGAGSPGHLLRSLNHELAGLAQPERFVALLCARVDARLGRLQVANAGLTPPLVLRRGGSREVVAESGLVLGVSDEAGYPDVNVQLRAGDLALLHTDGLTEARRGDELFGVERVWRVLEAHAHRRARDVLAALLAEVRAFAEPPLDDLTVLVLKQLAAPAVVGADDGLAGRAAWGAAPAGVANALKVRLVPADPSR